MKVAKNYSIFVSALACVIILLYLSTAAQFARAQSDPAILRVGKAQPYKTIQAAIDASAKDLRVVIIVDPGIYKERLFITRNNLAIVGHSAKSTVITDEILRETWRESHSDDWGGAVVNINASDIILANLTVENTYGKTHGDHSHQFAVRGFELSDKIITHSCSFVAGGADTLSLWNKRGRYYHSHCYFEGYVDMVCPRGTALIEDSQFFSRGKKQALWHDGELDPNYKLVVNRSAFDGEQGFRLGRHHYDAQFFLLNSRFSKNMADQPIYRKRYNNKNRERPNLYGERYFFHNNQSANSYPWVEDNFNLAHVVPAKHASIEDWVFGAQWSPKQSLVALEKTLEIYFNDRSIGDRFKL